MKKKVCFALTLSFLLGFSYGLTNIKEVKAEERIIIMNPSYGLGYSVNLAKDECLDIDSINNSVLDVSSLSTTNTTINTSSTVIKHSNDFNDLVDQVESYYALSSSCSTSDYSLFTGTVASKYPDTVNSDYVSNAYQYYSTYIYTYKHKSYSLSNYNTNLTSITRCLKDGYIDDLEALLYDDANINTFFDTYGTHVIGSMVTGGRLEINYSICSDMIDVWGEKYDSLTTYLSNNLYSKVQSSSSTISFDPQTACDIHTAASNQYIGWQNQGGTDFTISSINQINTVFNAWKNSVTSYPEIIQPTYDGLIPLWNLLPGDLNTTTYKNLFISKYNQYMASTTESISNNYVPTIIQEEYATTEYYPIRSGTLVVTDDSEFEQHCDVADLNSFAELKYDYFKHYGFTKMDVYLCMDMKEINMGYQHVNFYYSEKQDTAYRFSEHVCEVGGSSLQTEYTVMVFYRLNVPLSTFDNSDPDDYAKFVARYSASGSLEDDWQNMAIYLCIIYHN